MIIEKMIINESAMWSDEQGNHTEGEQRLIRRFNMFLDRLLEKGIRDRVGLASGLKSVNAFRIVERLEAEAEQIRALDLDHSERPNEYTDFEQF